jgi:hypothetical protein
MTEFILSTNVQSKAYRGATYKQIEYLKSFENVEVHASSSQIMKRIEMKEMSDAIEAAKAGQKVIIE